ncbi:MAG: hypothetical protein JKY49_00600 [Cohaesibacteraceae bacterium]|nr:hypothetical protein [Cohaesibacteraceae bacterium]
MKMLLTLCTTLFVFISSTAVFAAALNDKDKVQLQLALMDYVETNSNEGVFLHFDTKLKKLERLYPANLHPMIIPVEGMFFLCADFRTAEGDKRDVDFIAVPHNGEFRVIQAMVNQRNIVREVMQASKRAAK